MNSSSTETPILLQRRYSRLCLFIVISLLLSLAGRAEAQIKPLYDVFYRPLGLRYQVVETEQFRVIYQDGLRDQALETLWTLENTLHGADSLLGATGSFKFPVVLNGFSDDANGYVTAFPYKSEIEAPSIKGRSLSLRHTSWTEIVAAHELVHAAQAEYSRGFSLNEIVHGFAPDFARTLNLFMPSGITEGLAVVRESRLTDGAGRLNHPYFTMQYRAAMDRKGGMSLARQLENPTFTRPYDFHYLGGSHFVSFLESHYGPSSLRTFMRWQSQVPFMGSGFMLWVATGDPPWSINRKLKRAYGANDSLFVERLGPLVQGEVVASDAGRVHRRPRWLSNEEIVFYSVGYDLARAFRVLNTTTGKTRTLSRQETTEDADYSLTSDGREILFSRYVPDAWSPIKSVSKGYRLDIASREVSEIDGSHHTINPVALDEGDILALENNGQFNRIIEWTKAGEKEPRTDYDRSSFVSLIPRPGSDTLAVILKTGSHQGVFLVDKEVEPWSVRPWIGFDAASVYDASWSLDGRFLAFTSDVSGVLNVYVWDSSNDLTERMTNVRYAAMEPSISPDNSRIAYSQYRDESFDLAVMDFRPGSGSEVRNDWANSPPAEWSSALTKAPERAIDFLEGPYVPGMGVAPRMVYPTFYLDKRRRTPNDARMGLGVGLAVQGSDLMQRCIYYAEGIHQKGRIWGDFGVRTAVLPLIASASVFRQSETLNAEFVSDTEPPEQRRVIRDRNGFNLDLTLPITLRRNVSRTSVQIYNGISRRSGHFVDDDFEPITSRVTRWTYLPSVYFGYRLQQNARNIIPNSGASMRWFAEYDLKTEGLILNRGWVLTSNVYVPLLRRINGGIRLNAAFLRQNTSSIFDLGFFKPRGREDTFVPPGDHLRYGLDIVQPIWFPDNGTVILPVFVKAFYLYGFAEYLHPAEQFNDGVKSVGGGLGVLWRMFYDFNFEFRIGAAWLPDEKRWERMSELY